MCDVPALQGPVSAVIQVDRLQHTKLNDLFVKSKFRAASIHQIPLTCFSIAIVRADAVAPVQSVGLDLRICFTGIVPLFV